MKKKVHYTTVLERAKRSLDRAFFLFVFYLTFFLLNSLFFFSIHFYVEWVTQNELLGLFLYLIFFYVLFILRRPDDFFYGYFCYYYDGIGQANIYFFQCITNELNRCALSILSLVLLLDLRFIHWQKRRIDWRYLYNI